MGRANNRIPCKSQSSAADGWFKKAVSVHSLTKSPAETPCHLKSQDPYKELAEDNKRRWVKAKGVVLSQQRQ